MHKHIHWPPSGHWRLPELTTVPELALVVWVIALVIVGIAFINASPDPKHVEDREHIGRLFVGILLAGILVIVGVAIIGGGYNLVNGHTGVQTWTGRP